MRKRKTWDSGNRIGADLEKRCSDSLQEMTAERRRFADSLSLAASGPRFSFEPRSRSSWGGPWSLTEQDGNNRTSAFLLPRGLSRGRSSWARGLVDSLLGVQHHMTALVSSPTLPLLVWVLLLNKPLNSILVSSSKSTAGPGPNIREQ